ncbi:MAG: hypothetical protein BGP06_16400 [Rhizobiales bacterium 65-9]|nr:methyltransferase domain-containing protein [Hyphomicrobiales bacterium]OJY38041.1 MAG: hypothetical protein BGP06_16400 [Rhizobiales bacterium 65-9]
MFQSSGDLIADRRYDYAKAAAAEGDHGAARDLLAQTLELAPSWPAAWFALGEALLALGDEAGARDAYARCRALDPADEHGACVALEALDGRPGAAAMSPAYVRNLFDQYAERFDNHLTRHLAYRGPEVLLAAITRACAIEGLRTPFVRALDLGCGTGLFGEALGDMATAIDGVDLSPRMLRKAKKRGCYDRLSDEDMLAFLARAEPGRYDLVAAADVFVYVGDLAPVFAAAARALTPRGLFAFSIQRCENADYALGPERRFSHSIGYVETALRDAGFAPPRIELASTRNESKAPVPGAIATALRQR